MGLHGRLAELIEEQHAAALATVVAGPDALGQKVLIAAEAPPEGTLTPPGLIERVRADAERLLREERTETLSYEVGATAYEVFIEVFPVPRQLIIVGAAHAAGPLTTMARLLGYHVVVTDARAAFARAERFPDADEVIKGWPQDVFPNIRLDSSTYVVLLSHDPKFDEPTLDCVLPSPVRYVGAIGSRRTQEQRFERLRERGYTEEQLAKVHGPVGLDLGGRSAEETALAIMAEITAVRHGASGGFLRR